MSSVSASHQEAAPPGQPGRMVAGHFSLGVCFDTWRAAGTRDWLLMCTVSGKGRVGHLKGDVMVSAGDVVILRSAVRHDYGSERLQTDWQFFWAHFLPPPEWMPWLIWPEVAPGIMRVRLRPSSRSPVLRACETMVSRSLLLSPHAETLAMNALAEVIIRCDEERIRANQHQIDPRIERVINHCRVRLERVFLLPELAALAGLSPTSFSRLFAQEMGMPPMRYLEQLRINRACRLLELSQAKIESVARQVGFANPFYFTLRFKRQLGVSPRQYRLQAGRKRPTPRSVR